MKKLLVAILSLVMAVSIFSTFAFAEETAEAAGETPEYTKEKTYTGVYGFGEADITVRTNDAEDIFYITFYSFDFDQVLTGTVTDGICTVEYDASGFMAGDCQEIWDDAHASENPWTPVSEYTKQKVFTGVYGFGEADITVMTNDAEDIFYITFYSFDFDQVLTGTVADGICTVEYDASGFMAGDCQEIWDDAHASENPWTPVTDTDTDTGTDTAEAEEEKSSTDFTNWKTITTTNVLDETMEFKVLPSGYNEYDTPNKGTNEVIHYTTDVYGEEYEKFCRVYLPYGYDPEDKDTKYNVLYFQHGNGFSPNAIFDYELKTVHPLTLLDNIFDPEHGVMEPMIIVCPTYYLEYDESSAQTPGDNKAGDGRYEGIEGLYYREVVEDLIPAVESKYNVYCEDFSEEGIKASRDHRAWAGYSRGSRCTWYIFKHDLEYFKYFVPMSGPCDPECTPDDVNHEVAYDFLKETINSYPDLDFFIYATCGGEFDTPSMKEQVKYFLDRGDLFSYGLNMEENNFYFTCSDFVHADMYMPYSLVNAAEVLFK